jgi:hypothetical protein
MQEDAQPINVLELLDGIEFPTTREQAVVYANDNGASDDALNLLRAIPEKTYNDMKELNGALGQMRKPVGHQNIFSSALPSNESNE